MISRTGNFLFSADSQTPNLRDIAIVLIAIAISMCPFTGPYFGKQNWRCGMHRESRYGTKDPTHRSHKGCWFVKTAGPWPWKSEPAKKCVTTCLPNKPVPKKDDAQVGLLHVTGCLLV